MDSRERFGAAAAAYDQNRPGDPGELVDALFDRHQHAGVVELPLEITAVAWRLAWRRR